MEGTKNRLAELRKARSLTQEEVGKLTDQSPETVSRHESGARGMTRDVILKYSKLYKVESFEIYLPPQGDIVLPEDGV